VIAIVFFNLIFLYLCPLNFYRMKNLFFLSVLTFALFSCSGGKKQSEHPMFELDCLLDVVEQELDNTVTVVGFVTHTCKHSGKRCFIIGESQKATMMVEAGEIGGFNADLTGSKIAVTGVIKEHRRTEEVISQMEKSVHQRMEEGVSMETCTAELNNINDMRNWMKERGKDYYAVYYMDGISFDVLD